MTLDTAESAWDPANVRPVSATLPLDYDDMLDAIEEVEVTEELVVVAPDRIVVHPDAHNGGNRHAVTAAVEVPWEAPVGPDSASAPALPDVMSDPEEASVSLPSQPSDLEAVIADSDHLADPPPVVTPVVTPVATLMSARSSDLAIPVAAPVATTAATPTPASGTAVAVPSPVAPRYGAAQVVLLGAFGLDALLYMLVVPFLPSRAQALGASPLATSALFAMYAACLFLATPALGWLTDRLGARRVLLLGLVALAAATFAFAYAPGLPLLFAARGAQGVAAAATWTAGLALVVQLTSVERRPAIFARILMANGIGTLIGPPLGGLLYTLGGFSAPFVVVAALVLLDGCGRLIFLPGRRQLPAPSPVARRAGRAHPRQSPHVTFALLMTLAGAALLALAEPSIPLVLNTHFGVKPVVIGFVFGAVALVFILIQPLVAAVTRWVAADRAVAFGLVMSAGALVLEAVSPTALHAEFALIYLALGLSLILLPALEVLTRGGQTRVVTYGALFAAYNLAYAGGQLIGPLLSGTALTVFGPEQGFALLSLIPAALGFVLLSRERRRDRSVVDSPRVTV